MDLKICKILYIRRITTVRLSVSLPKVQSEFSKLFSFV